jgi:hypothetical protein
MHNTTSTPHSQKYQLSVQQPDTTTLISSMNRIERLVVNDAAWLLQDHIRVLSPEEFLERNFGSNDMEISQSSLDSKGERFHGLSFDSGSLKESSMYQPLVNIPHLQ